MFLGKTQLEQLVTELKLNIHKNSNINNIIVDIKEKNINSEYLSFTDVDNQQLCICLSEDLYIYSQQTFIFYDWNKDNNKDIEDYFTETYTLSNFNEDVIEEGISSFYPSLDNLKTEVGASWKQIAIECIFEEEALGN